MERQKITIGVPHLGSIDSEAQISIFNITTYLSAQKGYDVIPRYSEGTYLGEQRNEVSFMAKKDKSDLLFIDSDMVFDAAEIDYILDAMEKIPDIKIIGGLYYARRQPHFPVVMKIMSEEELEKAAAECGHELSIYDKEFFYKMNLKEIPLDEPFSRPNGLGVGTGFLYIKYEVLEEMWKKENVLKYGRPFSYWRMTNGDDIKEDLAFCLRAERIGFKVWCDPRLNLFHIGKQKVSRRTLIDFEYRDYLYGNDLEGYMNFDELNWLYHTIKRRGIKDVVEIGSYRGRSTHALCSAADMVYVVDDWGASQEILKMYDREGREWIAEEVYQDFMKNVGNRFKNISVNRMTSVQYASQFDKEVDMVFIDGAHEYEYVIKDIEAWNPKCKRLICGHDWRVFPGVEQAVQEVFGKTVKSYETLWYVWKDE